MRSAPFVILLLFVLACTPSAVVTPKAHGPQGSAAPAPLGEMPLRVAAPALPAPPAVPPRRILLLIIIIVARLVDPKAGKVLTDQAIAIEGDRIVGVGPKSAA
jgi:hypothetical protein